MDYGFSIQPFGEGAFILEAAGEISEAANRRVHALAAAMKAKGHAALVALVPAYTSLLVQYDPLAADFSALRSWAQTIARGAAASEAAAFETVIIPVCYEPPYALDLDDAAQTLNLSPREVVELHSSGDYLVYMLGFTPGFPYLGGMSERIALPRKTTPRVRVPAGSVGIADRQTGIYPRESPGGWNILGRTPAVLFDPSRDPPALLRSGQRVRFLPVPANEFSRIAESVRRGEWQPERIRASGRMP